MTPSLAVRERSNLVAVILGCECNFMISSIMKISHGTFRAQIMRATSADQIARRFSVQRFGQNMRRQKGPDENVKKCVPPQLVERVHPAATGSSA